MINNAIRIIEFPKILDERGNLSFFENDGQLPFIMKRVYWVYDVPGGEQRGGHAHSDSKEVIIALSGSFDLVLHDGMNEKRFSLNRSYFGIYIPKLIWRHLENFSTNSLALVATDSDYNPQGYIRDFESFLKLKNNVSNGF